MMKNSYQSELLNSTPIQHSKARVGDSSFQLSVLAQLVAGMFPVTATRFVTENC